MKAGQHPNGWNLEEELREWYHEYHSYNHLIEVTLRSAAHAV
jgi:hypothetical protein